MFWSVRGGGGVALATASLVAVLAVPRPEYPDAIPYPPVDTERTRVELSLARSAVNEALGTRLPTEVRGVGERVRRCGLLEVSDPQGVWRLEHDKLRESVLQLLQQKRGDDLVRLRELQAELLRRALLAKWSSSATATPEHERELLELGAKLATHLESSRAWFAADPHFDATLRALFVERWGNLVGFGDHPALTPSANDWRLIHRFRVLRLLRSAQTDGSELRAALSEVAKYSPDYPYDFAAGIVWYRMGAFEEAVQAFGRHLAQHPNSDYAVRAQNFRLEAARALVE